MYKGWFCWKFLKFFWVRYFEFKNYFDVYNRLYLSLKVKLLGPLFEKGGVGLNKSFEFANLIRISLKI